MFKEELKISLAASGIQVLSVLNCTVSNKMICGFLIVLPSEKARPMAGWWCVDNLQIIFGANLTQQIEERPMVVLPTLLQELQYQGQIQNGFRYLKQDVATLQNLIQSIPAQQPPTTEDNHAHYVLHLFYLKSPKGLFLCSAEQLST